MKIAIHFDIKPIGGGGNNFLNYFCDYLRKKELYTPFLTHSDIILINSHHRYTPDFPSDLLRRKKIVHRLDGLPKLYNEPNDARQDYAILFNKIAHANIFQSKWSLDEYRKCGLNTSKHNMICYNGTSETFISVRENKFKKDKLTILNVSWSNNANKGRDDFLYLIENIDYSKYNVIHVGPGYGLELSKYPIKHIKQLEHRKLAGVYQNSDIFFTGARYECCSNAIIEAQTCGLPVLAINSGSNNELVKNNINGLLYNSKQSIIHLLNEISNNIDIMSKRTNIFDIQKVSKKYIKFFEYVLQN